MLIANKSNFIQTIMDEHQALEILLILASKFANGAANEFVLSSCLDGFALGGSQAQIRTALHRLEAVGLIRTETIDRFGEPHIVAVLLDQGRRVAEGKDACDGVARPSRG